MAAAEVGCREAFDHLVGCGSLCSLNLTLSLKNRTHRVTIPCSVMPWMAMFAEALFRSMHFEKVFEPFMAGRVFHKINHGC